MWPQNKFLRRFLKTLSVILILSGVLFGLFIWTIRIPSPEIKSSKTIESYKRIQLAPDHFVVEDSWLKKNKQGIWEMYLAGNPYERGLKYGILARELMEKQEVHFVDQINEMIPNKFFLQVIKGFVGWFNKDIYKYIPEENLEEIYGVSKSFSDKYDYIGPKYYRILNYHAAHDIGHALTDLNMVGCTSFSVNKKFSADSTLLIARNFDFYMGDAFAEDKLIVFIKPDKGYKFASYAWAGLTGVVSGMNEKGLTVTLNASKSDIPYGAKDPISLLAREILQYSKNIKEAVAIARKRETFVSESLLIGSAEDDKSVIIEKSPQRMDVYDSGIDYLVCANHYQSSKFIRDSTNIININTTDSKYRFDRISELMKEKFPIDVKSAVGILRNKNGMGEKFIGYGNFKSINQLIAHHGIVFKPSRKTLWISSPPYQLGEFVAYNLDVVFGSEGKITSVDSLDIPADAFIQTKAYTQYESYKKTKQRISKYVMLGKDLTISQREESRFIMDNPESFLTYLALGDYYHKKKNMDRAISYYKKSLEKDVSSIKERDVILNKIKDIEGKE